MINKKQTKGNKMKALKETWVCECGCRRVFNFSLNEVVCPFCLSVERQNTLNKVNEEIRKEMK